MKNKKCIAIGAMFVIFLLSPNFSLATDCASYLYHTGCRNESDLYILENDYNLANSGRGNALKIQCKAEIQEYEEKITKYEQCLSLQEEEQVLRMQYLEGQINQLTAPKCSEGYIMNSDGSACVTITKYCQSIHGVNSYGSGQSCYCSPGYQISSMGKACVKIETPVPVYQPPTQTHTTPKSTEPATSPKTNELKVEDNEPQEVSTTTNNQFSATQVSPSTTTSEDAKTKISWLLKVWRFIWRF